MQAILNSFSLTIAGLKLSYSIDGKNTVTTFDPMATCNILEDLKIIEGFDQDRNGEPVILFTDGHISQLQTGFVFWFRFVEGFRISQRMAEIIVERLEMTRQFAKTHAIINRLMKPLKAA